MKKLVVLMMVLCLAFFAFAGCSASGDANGDAEQSTNETVSDGSSDSASSDQGTSGGTDSAEETIKITVIVKSTDSESWQYMMTGATNAALDSNGKIEVTLLGAASESDIEGQVAILENAITSEPDAIVITPSDSDAVVPALEEAYQMGIKIIVVDTIANTDSYDMFMANDNYAGGELMAEQFIEYLSAANIEPKGTVGIVSAVPVQTVYDRDDGFIEKLAELAPDITVIAENYVENDLQKSIDLANDYMTANDDLIGLYGDNNVTGSGIALAIAEMGVSDNVIGVAYDGNPEEIAGIRDGSLKAILVQDLYNWGYIGVQNAYKAATGETLNKYYNTGVTLVTLENVGNDEIQDVLDPSRLER